MKKSYFVFGMLCVSVACLGQDKTMACDKSFPYEDHNLVDYDLGVSAVRFTVIWPDGEPMSKACAAIFDERSHKLQAVAESTADGKIEFSGLRSGRYRLVVADPQRVLCSANARLVVSKAGVNRFFVNMRATGVDTCSWCGEKKTEK